MSKCSYKMRYLSPIMSAKNFFTSSLVTILVLSSNPARKSFSLSKNLEKFSAINIYPSCETFYFWKAFIINYAIYSLSGIVLRPTGGLGFDDTI
jgi:hypothetical protein